MKRILSLIATMMLTLGTLAANIETDRSWYLAGEAMKVSVTTDNALIAYAELCDTYSLVAGAVIGLAEGKGTGTIELPSNMHSGYYVLSVYTRDNANVSRKLVAVVNPLRSSADDDIEWVQITDSDSLSYSATIAGESLTAAAMTDEKDVDVRETEGHIIKARVTNAYRGVTYKSHQIHPSLGIVGKQVHYFEGKMVNDTTAVFYTYGLHGKQPLVLSAATYTGVSLPIEMISPFASLLPRQLPHLVFHYRRSEVEARSMEMQRHQIAIAPAKKELQLGYYENAAAEEGVPMDYDNTLFGEHPDLTYNLDEYRQFLTVREVLLEYISCVQRTKVDGVPQLMVRDEQGNYDSSWPAMVFIDGMPVIDVDRLLNYDARRIHYVNIFRNNYTFGNGVYRGIVSFISRSGRLTNYPTEPNTQYVVYEFPE